MYLTKEQVKKDIEAKILSLFAVDITDATGQQVFVALGNLIRDYCARGWVDTNKTYEKYKEKQVYYFSIEFLLGKMLKANLLNLGILDVCDDAITEMGFDLDEIQSYEPEPGLGNGGLGRLAACFLDSMAALAIPGHGCGIRYKYGLFEQKFIDGYQVEVPENWLREGNVWEVRKPDKAVLVKFKGELEIKEEEGRFKVTHKNYEPVLAVPYDTPVIGFDNNTVNNLRLFSAEMPSHDFDLAQISHGDYKKALDYKYSVESISQVLYPDDSSEEGKALRLKQEYFMVSAGVQSIIRRYKKLNLPIEEFNEKVSIHINDTHPALCIPELMRILLDEYYLSWDKAWEITTLTMSYTNHTILSEALETWSADLMRNLLPRIYMIIEEINRRFCEQLIKLNPDNQEKINAMAIIAHSSVRMANLAIVGSHSTNGVAKLHTEILKNRELNNFYQMYPARFNNKTNGITHRRWLMLANPNLSNLVTETIGDIWKRVPTDLIKLKEYNEDSAFLSKIEQIKYDNKVKLADVILKNNDIIVDPSSIFDVQVKRLHAYKRQLMNALHILHLYHRIIEDSSFDMHPRTFIFGAKAAPGYYLAKKIIKFINSIANMINNDPRVKGRLKVVFMENYSVTLAQSIIPAADVSEQISTASKEASGTGNMKFMMNGAVTLATMDGANVEIFNEVGNDNIVIFGLTAKEVLSHEMNHDYKSVDIYHRDYAIRRVIDDLINGFIPGFSVDDGLDIYHHLITHNDSFFVLRDFKEYSLAHQKIDSLYKKKDTWNKMCVDNIASSGQFTSDRTITSYANGIWSTRIGEHF